jgi:hypothetical protein
MSFIKDRYKIITKEQGVFLFQSKGDKGDFTLAGAFQPVADTSRRRRGISINYNLAYGVLQSLPGGSFHLDDQFRLGNGDEDRIFNTLAYEVSLFMKEDPLNVISFSGSTPARTRKYRQQLSRHFDEISEWFDIYGLNPETGLFEEFIPNSTISYESFLIENKIS